MLHKLLGFHNWDDDTLEVYRYIMGYSSKNGCMRLVRRRQTINAVADMSIQDFIVFVKQGLPVPLNSMRVAWDEIIIFVAMVGYITDVITEYLLAVLKYSKQLQWALKEDTITFSYVARGDVSEFPNTIELVDWQLVQQQLQEEQDNA